MCPRGVTDFGAPVTNEIDLHLPCKENTAIYNAHCTIKKSKAVSSLQIFLLLLFSPELKLEQLEDGACTLGLYIFLIVVKVKEQLNVKQHSSYMDGITNKKHLA